MKKLIALLVGLTLVYSFASVGQESKWRGDAQFKNDDQFKKRAPAERGGRRNMRGGMGMSRGQGGRGNMRGGMGMSRGQGGGGDMFSQLNLTDDQKTKLMDLKRSEMKKKQMLRSSTQNYRSELMQLMTEDKLNESRIKALIKQLTEASKKKLEDKLESAKKLREILTEEQIKKLNFSLLMNGKRGGRDQGQKGMRGQRGSRRGQERGQNRGQNRGMRGNNNYSNGQQQQMFPQNGN